MTLLNLPPDYPRIRRVKSFEELIGTPFLDGVNALVWERSLPGNFSEVVELLGAGEGILNLDESQLHELPLSAAGRVAVEVLIADLQLLRAHELAPMLNCIHGYPRDEHAGPVATDVFSFHADSATAETDTWLCTYHGTTSEGLRNDEAQRRVDDPVTRAELLRIYGDAEDDGFREFLRENCYNLHYASMPQAKPFSFGLGNLWRIATEWPGCQVPPCIHRAPQTFPGQSPRLLLIC